MMGEYDGMMDGGMMGEWGGYGLTGGLLYILLPTLLMFPVLVIAYYRLARREESELEERFEEGYVAYRARTPMVLPGLRMGRILVADDE